MNTAFKVLLLGSIGWSVSLSAAQAQTAAPTSAPEAPAAAAASGSAIGEIIVTANKRQENIQKVGQTITAISGSALAERHIQSLQDLAAAVPGLSFTSSTANTPIYTLRGVGFNESSLAVYPAVSVYVDEIPLPFPVLASHSDYDLERVEVLKGPQGTLFGENSTGGAINYIAAKPTATFDTGADLTYGRFNQLEGNFFINGRVADNLDARLAVTGEREDAWQRSYTRTDKNGKQSYFAGRLSLKWTPTDTLRVNFNVNGWHDTSQPEAQQVIAIDLSKPQYASIKQPLLNYPLSPLNARSADWSTGAYRPTADRNFVQAGLRVDLDLTPGITLTSLTSYDFYKQTEATDGDGMDLNIFDLSRDNGSIHSFNQELRVANSSRAPIRWVVGGNYENTKSYEDQILDFGDGGNSNPSNFDISTSGVINHQAFTNYAAFGNLEYDVVHNLTLKGGVRYTHTKDDAYICGYSPGADNGNIPLFEYLGELLGGQNIPLTSSSCYTLNYQNLPGTPFTSTLSQHNVSWRAGADYKGIENTLLYVNVSRGYKAGSFPSLAAGTFAQLQPVVQEQLQAYEGGFKSQLFDHHVQLNGAAFYYDYKNKQVRGKLEDPVFGALDALVNVPKSRVYGFEGDLTVHPVHGLTLSASATYLNSKVDDYTGYNVLGTVQDFAGASLPNAPRWSVGTNAEYNWTLSDGASPFIGASTESVTHTDGVLGGSETEIPASSINRIEAGVGNPFLIRGYTTVDARLGYKSADGKWKVMIWGKNIFNTYSWNNVVVTADSVSRLANMPATYGITLSWKH